MAKSNFRWFNGAGWFGGRGGTATNLGATGAGGGSGYINPSYCENAFTSTGQRGSVYNRRAKPYHTEKRGNGSGGYAGKIIITPLCFYSPTPTPTITPSPTITPTPTHTPSPTRTTSFTPTDNKYTDTKSN